ncbi:MAG: hypothetical protein OYH77_08920 [Pseudomonadota bacterium]|nr:hypothetical protein [Pseudomonadota bacterium]
MDPIITPILLIVGGLATGFLGYEIGVKTCGIMPLVMTAGCSVFGTLLLVRSGLTDLIGEKVREKVTEAKDRRRARLARRAEKIEKDDNETNS